MWGLACEPRGLTSYEEAAWQGRARDRISLSNGAGFLLPELGRRLELQGLPYNLELQDCLALVGHRKVMTDPAFPAT